MKRSIILLTIILVLVVASSVCGSEVVSKVDYLQDKAYGFGVVPVANQGIQSAKDAAINIAKVRLIEEVYFSRLKSPLVKVTFFEDKGKEWRIKGLVQVGKMKIWKIEKAGEVIRVRAMVRIPIFD